LRALPKPEQCPDLKLIHFFSAGTNHIQKHPIYTDTDITLTTSSGIHGPQIAEWVILTTLSHTHRYPMLLKWQNEHHWGGFHGQESPDDLVGRRIGVLGYGSIGRQGEYAPQYEVVEAC
jgi:phosphoglycerate dehydrogenase-like enzyme